MSLCGHPKQIGKDQDLRAAAAPLPQDLECLIVLELANHAIDRRFGDPRLLDKVRDPEDRSSEQGVQQRDAVLGTRYLADMLLHLVIERHDLLGLVPVLSGLDRQGLEKEPNPTRPILLGRDRRKSTCSFILSVYGCQSGHQGLNGQLAFLIDKI